MIEGLHHLITLHPCEMGSYSISNKENGILQCVHTVVKEDIVYLNARIARARMMTLCQCVMCSRQMTLEEFGVIE